MKIDSNKLVELYRSDVVKPSKLLLEYMNWFDNLKSKPISYYFAGEDLQQINKLAISPYMHTHPLELYGMLDDLMEKRGFNLVGGGTNRRAYRSLMDDKIVSKIAYNRVGMNNNISDISNQHIIKPFCCKIFEIAPYGVMGLNEEIVPFKDVSEYIKYAQEIFDIMYYMFRNNDIAIDDIGASRYKQWGCRSGFGPVICDFPTMFVADPKKRLCKAIFNGRICNGSIDYDDTFDNILCSECGTTYKASDLAKTNGGSIDLLMSAVGRKQKSGGFKSMKLSISQGEQVITTLDFGGQSNFVDRLKQNAVRNNSNKAYNNSSKNVNQNAKGINIRISGVTSEEEQLNTVLPAVKPKEKSIIDKFNTLNIRVLSGLDPSFEPLTEVAGDVFNYNKSAKYDLSTVYLESNAATLLLDKSMNKANVAVDKEVSYVNMMLNEFRTNETSSLWDIFWRLTGIVKNSQSFFISIVNFWHTVLEDCSFEKENCGDSTVFCIHRDIYDVYHRTVQDAITKFKASIKYISTYNNKITLDTIVRGLSQIKLAMEDIEEYVDETKIVQIELGKDTVSCTTLNTGTGNVVVEPVQPTVVTENEIIDEPTDDDVTDTVIETVDDKVDPVEFYDAYVTGSEKQGTRKQQEKWNGKRKKKYRK